MSEATTGDRALTTLLNAVAETLGTDPGDGSASFRDLDGDSLSAIIVTEILRDDGLHLEVEALLSGKPLDQVARQFTE